MLPWRTRRANAFCSEHQRMPMIVPRESAIGRCNHRKESNGDMSLDSQKARSDRTSEASDTIPERHTAGGIGKTRFGFAEKDFVVYPAHGVGQILAIEEQTVAGASLEFFVIYFAKSKMTVRVPTRKAANAGLRKPTQSATIQRVKRLLGETPRKGKGTWARLAQEYQAKINSGDIVAIAEVVRDLFRPSGDFGQSFSERQLYASALGHLCGEVSLIDGISDEQSARMLEDLISAGASLRKK
jgi:CarD family transcriptional regulator